MFGQACKTKVIGQTGEWVQHSLQDGNRETATLMVLISAASACKPPCVIFKGQKLNSIWSELENNPLQCPIWMSEKGYSSQVIGRQWIETVFGPQTRDIANGHTRLLIVDSHSSHFTYELLDYARSHDIIIICLPPHTTHALQTLDVLGFS